MKKIAIDIRMLESGGIGTYISHVIPYLVHSYKKVNFILLGDPSHELVKNWKSEFTNISVIKCSARIYSVQEQIELFRKIPRDVDFVFSPHFNISVAWAHKTVTTIHDCFHLEYFEFFSFTKRLYLKLIFFMIRNFGLGILTVSKFSQSQISNFLNLSPSKINVTSLGVDPYEGDIIHEKENYFLFVGNLKPHKNIKVIVDALDLVRDELPHKLVIVGTADNHLNPDLQIEEYKERLGDRIIFTGHISNDELKQLYKKATALIFPSFYEGFGLPSLEAKSFGCPTILSNINVFKEVNGDSSIYFSPSNAEELALRMKEVNTPLKQSELIEKGVQVSSAKTWSNSLAKISKAFKITCGLEF